MKKLVKLAINNLWSGIADYRRHSRENAVLNNISDAFVERLAEDSVNAKADLRNLFSKSDAWNHNLQAIVINGTKTHNPDFSLVRSPSALSQATLLLSTKPRTPSTSIGLIFFHSHENSLLLYKSVLKLERVLQKSKRTVFFFQPPCGAVHFFESEDSVLRIFNNEPAEVVSSHRQTGFEPQKAECPKGCF